MIIGGIRWKRINGITLIALVITIIIIVILAAVTLSFIFNGGVLDKAELAVFETRKSQARESIETVSYTHLDVYKRQALQQMYLMQKILQ